MSATSRIPRPADLRAAAWTLRTHVALRRRIAAEGSEATVPLPPAIPDAATRAVRATLRARRASCLESAIVLQSWHAAHGRPLDLVIGVTAPGAGFHAHAWLEAEPSRAPERDAGVTALDRAAAAAPEQDAAVTPDLDEADDSGRPADEFTEIHRRPAASLSGPGTSGTRWTTRRSSASTPNRCSHARSTARP
ncbi:MAG: lasso peptide biosynthesis B2 protein [Solirubrobacterales bacterium]